jgi:hypothetical protein
MSNHNWEEEIRKGPDRNWSRGAIQTANCEQGTTPCNITWHHLSRFNITDDPATCRLCTNGFLDDFLKVSKYHFLRIQAFRKINKA